MHTYQIVLIEFQKTDINLLNKSTKHTFLVEGFKEFWMENFYIEFIFPKYY